MDSAAPAESILTGQAAWHLPQAVQWSMRSRSSFISSWAGSPRLNLRIVDALDQRAKGDVLVARGGT